MAAAISAARRGASVAICEKMPRLGRKVLASGNGRCNLTNDALDSSFYNPAAAALVTSIFSRFGNSCIKDLFEDLGLKTHSEDGRVFPVTHQSSSVLKVIELELKRLSVVIEHGFDVSGISHIGDGFIVTSKAGRKLTSLQAIIACGGRSYPAFGSDGSAYALARSLGHSIVEPVPDAVPLSVKDPMCHSLQGQKIRAGVRALIDGTAAQESSGDLLFTKYGLSGTAILDVSESVSIAMNRAGKKDVALSVDMVPFMDEKALSDEIGRRMGSGYRADDLIVGILPNKFAAALKGVLTMEDPASIAQSLKDTRFTVLGTRGWNEAEFTAGGVALTEIDEVGLESKLKKGLYFAGEILDVNGRRGGYNLAWAWASGFVAGEAAANA